MKHTLLSIFSFSACLNLNAQCVEGTQAGNSDQPGSYEVGQSFIAPCSGTLQFVEFFSTTSTTVSGTLKVRNGNTMSSTPIYTQTYTNVPVAANGPLHIDITGTVNLFGGNQYTVSMDMSGATQYGINTYSGGRFWLATSNIPQYASRDLNFLVSVNSNCTNTSAFITESACFSYQLPSGLFVTVTGIYNDTIFNAAGCDSIITIDLTVTDPDVSVTDNGSTLTANAVNATYQWIEDCNNSQDPIAGATAQSFTPTVSGFYAVWVTQNGCTNLSACYQVIVSGVDDQDEMNVSVFPNPSNGRIQILSQTVIDRITVFDAAGTRIQGMDVRRTSSTVTGLSSGFYIAQVEQEGRIERVPFVVN